MAPNLFDIHILNEHVSQGDSVIIDTWQIASTYMQCLASYLPIKSTMEVHLYMYKNTSLPRMGSHTFC